MAKPATIGYCAQNCFWIMMGITKHELRTVAGKQILARVAGENNMLPVLKFYSKCNNVLLRTLYTNIVPGIFTSCEAG
jgi:hypothetical protein